MTSDVSSGAVFLADGTRLAFSQAGGGPDVVLIHGALVTREDMVLALFAALSDGLRVTAFDRPGHGASTRSGWTGSPWWQAAALREACGRLGIHRPGLIGHSYGGAVAMAFALQFPRDLAGVVALAPVAFPELRLEHLVFGPRAVWPMGPLMNRAVSAALDPVLLPVLWRAMFMPQPIPERYAAVFPYAWVGRAAHTEAEGEDALLLNLGLARSAMNYARCEAPVRIFGGDQDLVVNNAAHGRLAATMVPNGSYESLTGLGHMLHHFAHGPIIAAARSLALGS